MVSGGRVVVVGAHSQALFLHAEAIPSEGETVLGWGFEETVDGGKSTNQAVACTRLGAPTALVTLLGDDRWGRSAAELFAREGIDVGACPTPRGATDVGFVMLPPSRVPAIVTSTDRSRELTGHLIETAAAVFEGASCVVCCLEAPQSAAIAAFRLGRAQGATTLLNAAPAVPLEEELVELTDVLVANAGEAAALAGGDGTPQSAAAARERLGLRALVATAGADGAVVADAEGLAPLPAPQVDVVDTTGAGDCFVGALAARLQAGDGLRDACALALRAASISVTRAGTMLAYPRADELAAW